MVTFQKSFPASQLVQQVVKHCCTRKVVNVLGRVWETILSTFDFFIQEYLSPAIAAPCNENSDKLCTDDTWKKRSSYAVKFLHSFATRYVCVISHQQIGFSPSMNIFFFVESFNYLINSNI